MWILLILLSHDTTTVNVWKWGSYQVRHVFVERDDFEEHMVEVVDGGGRKLYSSSSYEEASYAIPTSVKIMDLNGDGKRELFIEYFTAGAHCCYIYHILGESGGKVKLIQEISTADSPVKIRDLDGDGSMELIFGDMSLAYVFTSFAGSPVPFVVLKYSPRNGKWLCSGRLTRAYNRKHITSEYPNTEEYVEGDRLRVDYLERAVRMIYAGRIKEAHRLIMRKWNGSRKEAEQFWKDLMNALKDSPYFSCVNSN